MGRPLFTVKRLRAMARDGQSLELPGDALITPAADDWLQGAGVRVTRAGAAEPKREARPTIYVIGDGSKSVLKTLLPIMDREHDEVRFLPCNGCMSGLMDAIKTACEGLAECSRRRAIVLVEEGAISTCVANKHPKVRAAMVSRPSHLFGAMQRLGANLLVLEIGSVSLRQLKATIDEFLTGRVKIEPEIEGAIGGTFANAGVAGAGA